MTLQQFKYALALRDTGSFQKAADQCFVTQPTLSQQIQKLEEHLGITLFDRSRQPVMPTQEGAALLEQIARAYREAQKIEVAVSEIKGQVKGEFRLGVIPTLAPYLIPRFLNTFAKKYPDVQLTIQELQTAHAVDDLTHGKLDGALVVTPLEDAALTEEVLFYEPIWLYLSKGHELLRQKEIDEQHLSASDVFLLSEGHCFRGQVMNLCRSKTHSKSRNVQIESGSLETVKRLVDQGSGYTLLPELAVLDLVKADQKKYLRPFAKPVPTREVSMVVYRHFVKQAIKEALKTEIMRSIPVHIATLKPHKKAIVPLS